MIFLNLLQDITYSLWSTWCIICMYCTRMVLVKRKYMHHREKNVKIATKRLMLLFLFYTKMDEIRRIMKTRHRIFWFDIQAGLPLYSVFNFFALESAVNEKSLFQLILFERHCDKSSHLRGIEARNRGKEFEQEIEAYYVHIAVLLNIIHVRIFVLYLAHRPCALCQLYLQEFCIFFNKCLSRRKHARTYTCNCRVFFIPPFPKLTQEMRWLQSSLYLLLPPARCVEQFSFVRR